MSTATAAPVRTHARKNREKEVIEVTSRPPQSHEAAKERQRCNDVIYGYAPPPGWKRVQVIATGEIIGLLCRDAVEGIDRGCPRGAVCPGHPVLVTRP
jgi:hypothetical protein